MGNMQAAGESYIPADDASIRAQAESLVAGMTTAEKAGQLTQFFYFGFQRETGGDPNSNSDSVNLPEMVEAALRRGEVVLYFS